MSELHEDESRRTEALARVGTTLRGKWRLDALLGLGGMAAVYAATHRNGMRGAVKVLDLSLSRLETMRERFLREGYLANKVDHPCAVRVLDDDVAEDGSAFLVMELLKGKTLEDLAQDHGGNLPAEEVLAYAWQVLDALTAAHALGIVHRDIKPDNLFLTEHGLIKILDFGLARMLETQRTTTSTQSGVSMGTPAFMSPEQARGRWDLVDARSDLWGLAASMFTLLTGRLVHQDHETAAEMIAATFMQQAPSLSSVMSDAPAELISVVDGGLRLERDLRWASAVSMSAAVAVAYQVLTGSEVPRTPSIPPLSAPLVSSRPPASRPSGEVSRPSGDPVLSFSPSWSQRPRLHSDVSPTVPPPPAAGKSRWIIGAAGAAVALVAVGAVVVLAHHQPSRAAAIAPSSAPVAPQSPARPEAPPSESEPQPAPVALSAAPGSTSHSHAGPSVAKTKPRTAGHAAKEAGVAPPPPIASASAAPGPNLFDRRY